VEVQLLSTYLTAMGDHGRTVGPGIDMEGGAVVPPHLPSTPSKVYHQLWIQSQWGRGAGVIGFLGSGSDM